MQSIVSMLNPPPDERPAQPRRASANRRRSLRLVGHLCAFGAAGNVIVHGLRLSSLREDFAVPTPSMRACQSA